MAGTRQRIFLKKNKKSLPSASRVGTRQRIFFKKNKKSLPSAWRVGHRNLLWVEAWREENQERRKRDAADLGAVP